MILIADSGSTKSDWRMINSLGDNLKDFSTMGFNPYFHSSDLVEAKLKQSTEAMEIALSIEHVFFQKYCFSMVFEVLHVQQPNPKVENVSRVHFFNFVPKLVSV